MSADNVQEPPTPMPTVLIVGSGIGGLMLGTLFERINIPYHIFERASKLRSLGSAMTLGANILPVFEQLGLLEEIYKISMPCPSLNFFDSSVRKVGSITLMGEKGTGYENLIFTRPKLYEILRNQVPTHKISLNKKVHRSEEIEDGIQIHCSDGTTYKGHILIGADGAYSSVRQSLYKRMDEQGILPKSDLEKLTIGSIAMVGVATPPNPEKYPQLKDKFSHFCQVTGDNSTRQSWSAVSILDNQICWGLGHQLSESEAKEQHFRNSEWGPETNDAMIKEYQDFPCPVFIEEKFFKTWFHGRTVLVGDACHKMYPGAGLGAVNAMHDAVILANCIYAADDVTPAGITKAYEDYYNQRYQFSYEQFKNSSTMTKTLFGETWSERLTRRLIHFAKTLCYRPQIAWLPLAVNRGTVRVLPQTSKRKVIKQ